MNLLQEYLIEQAFNESLDKAYEFYKDKMPREQFDKLIALDPTFVAGQDKKGTYTKWIIDAYLRKSLTDEELINVEEILNDFHSRKRFITTEGGKDIFKYKTLKDIRDALNNIRLTNNQIAKQNRKIKQHADLGEEAEYIAETDEWEVWTPKTLAASMKLGASTQWCTARPSSASTYFPRYTKNWGEWRGSRGDNSETDCGKLFIFNHKTDEREKYQLHVIYDVNGVMKNSGDFMNIDDNSRNFKEFLIINDLGKDLATTELGSLKDVKESLEISNLLKSGKITIKDSSLEKDNIFVLDNGMELSKELFVNSKIIIKKVIIKTVIGMTVLNGDIFQDTKIESVVFDKKSNVKRIAEDSFKNCSSLKTVVLPGKLEVISSSAFKGCTSLTEVVLPDSVTYIGFKAFSDSNNLVLKMSRRKGKNKIKVPQADIPFLQPKIVYIDDVKSASVETSPTEVKTESIILNEVFSPSMPDWLKSWLRKEGQDISRYADKDVLRVKLVGPSSPYEKERYERNDYYKGINTGSSNKGDYKEYGYLDLNKANFISAPKPKSSRDALLRPPYLPIFKLTYKPYNEREGVTEELVYIPGINDGEKPDWDNWSNRKELYKYSKTEILEHTSDFCYIDLNDSSNFISKEEKKQRNINRTGQETRYNPSEIERIQSRRSRERKFDKSGYRLDPERLVNMLKKYNMDNYSSTLKTYYEKLESLRQTLQKELKEISIKKARPDEKSLTNAFERLFTIINSYRRLKEGVEKALNSKDKKYREAQLKAMFGVKDYNPQSKEYEYEAYSEWSGDTFEDLRQKINVLEIKLKELVLGTLEGYPAYGIAVN